MRARTIHIASLLVIVAFVGCESVLDRVEGHTGSNHGASGPDEASSGTTDDDSGGATDVTESLAATNPGQASAATSAQPAAASAPLTITLDTRIFTLVVGGSAAATAEFSWTTVGSTSAIVEIQMKSSVTNSEWTPILMGLPASDVGARYELPLVRQTLWFRAVATESAATNTGVSNIVRFD